MLLSIHHSAFRFSPEKSPLPESSHAWASESCLLADFGRLWRLQIQGIPFFSQSRIAEAFQPAIGQMLPILPEYLALGLGFCFKQKSDGLINPLFLDKNPGIQCVDQRCLFVLEAPDSLSNA